MIEEKCNFENQSLPTETALRVLWNIDVFTFKVNMKEKPKTRKVCCQHSRDYHNTVAYGGRNATMQEIRATGY